MLSFLNRAFCVSTFTVSALLIGGCEVDDPRFSAETQYLGGTYGTAPTGAPQDTISYWDGDGLGGKPSIKISISQQRAYFYRGGLLVGISQLSTGREETNTPTGKYSILQKDKEHVSNLYGDFVDAQGNVIMPNVGVKTHSKPPGTKFKGAPMPYFMRITPGGVGLHAGYLPGYPASHGCIRMPEFMAESFFKSVSTGTPVTIVP